MVDALKLVCIGGGTGLSSLLSGIKQHTSNRRAGSEIIDIDNLAAIVSVSDDGGSSGRLVEEFDVIPPGDIRKLLVALSNDDELLAKLFEYRFSSDGDLGGHTVGNLLLIALTELNNGNFPKAIQEASKLLSTRGRIIPVSLDGTTLCAELVGGDIVCGESNIPERSNREPIQRVFLKPRENGKQHHDELYECAAHTEAVEAIANADAIIIGPGSLYTSIMPNLVIKEIAKTIQSSDAMKIYICNVMTQPGETDGYSVTNHVEAILSHAPGISLDYVLVNNQPAPEKIIERYRQKELSGKFAQIKMHTEEVLSMLETTQVEDFAEGKTMDSVLYLTEYISQLTNETKQMAGPSNVQIFYNAERDNLGDMRIVEAELIRDTTEVINSGGPQTVIRHHPEKLAQTLVKVLSGHPKFHESIS